MPGESVNEQGKKILGPVGYLFKAVCWTIEKLFVIRNDELPVPPPSPVIIIDDGREWQDGPEDDSSMLDYTAQEGDTIEGVARLFVVRAGAIREVNPVLQYRELIPGETIKIPPMDR